MVTTWWFSELEIWGINPREIKDSKEDPISFSVEEKREGSGKADHKRNTVFEDIYKEKQGRRPKDDIFLETNWANE